MPALKLYDVMLTTYVDIWHPRPRHPPPSLKVLASSDGLDNYQRTQGVIMHARRSEVMMSVARGSLKYSAQTAVVSCN